MIGPIFLVVVLAFAVYQLFFAGPAVDKRIEAKVLITKAGDVYTMKVTANGVTSVLQVESIGQDAFVGSVKEGFTSWLKGQLKDPEKEKKDEKKK